LEQLSKIWKDNIICYRVKSWDLCYC
jgi:hypothetical protein